jgi:hypothetical protein
MQGSSWWAGMCNSTTWWLSVMVLRAFKRHGGHAPGLAGTPSAGPLIGAVRGRSRLNFGYKGR